MEAECLVPLTKGLCAVIDDADYELVADFSWRAVKTHPKARTHYAYAESAGYMHHLLTGWDRVDHVNGDGLDNRRANLRPASSLENAQNRRKRQDSSSRYKGVHWIARDQRWRAGIRVNGVALYLGQFKGEVEAARAYDTAARQHFGEFASINFPKEGERSALTGEIVALGLSPHSSMIAK